MNESVRLGSIAGIRVGVNWSVLVVFALIASSLAAGYLPAQHPGLPPGTYAVAGLVAAALFLLSLLAHEMAHALVARRNGIGVEGIVLWLFGGVARLEGDAATPGAELRVAGVGPLVSLVLAGLFGAVAGMLGAAGVPDIATDTCAWLGIINAALAVFNLVPAAPLDGGRLLRALLWWRSGDRTRATVAAARAGTVFGFTLIGLGLVEFAFFAGLGGLWFVLLGWFLVNAAQAEEQYATVRAQLGGVTVADAMTPDPVVAPAGLSVDAFLDRYVFRHRHSTFPLVGGDGRPVGAVTLGRLKEVPPEQRATTSVARLATPIEEIPTARPDEPLADLLPRMSGSPTGRALVVDGHGRVVGIVSPADVLRVLELSGLRDHPRRFEHV